jgi:diguanylate cyclase (GGDEF)-like protein/PAS domain S-box-containing protein
LDGPVIGVLSPYLSGPYHGALVSAILRAASAAGAGVAAVQTAGPGRRFHHSDQEPVGRVGWGRVAGFVTIANAVPADYLKEFRATTGKPVVAIGNEEAGFSCPSVMTDNRGGVKRAVEHLLAHGHTRIAFVGFLEQFDIRERYESYLATLRSHGIEPAPELFFETASSVEQGGRSAARAMLAAASPATAAVVATDLSAIGLMATLKAGGLALPQDLAVVGFDDMPGCGLQSPSLSSVSQNFDQLGTKAVELMMRLVRGEQLSRKRFVLPASFIARESCGCVGAVFGARARAGSGPGRSAEPGPEDPLAVFLRAVGPSAAGLAGAGPGRLIELAGELAGTFADASYGDLSPLELLRLGQVCEEIYARHPGQATADAVMTLAARFTTSPGLDGGTGGGRDDGRTARLGECLAQVRLAVAKAGFGERNDAYYSLRKAMRDEYEITLDLMAGDGDPTSLEWLHRTGARLGLLAFWQDLGEGGTGGERLRQQPVPGQEPVVPGQDLAVTGTFVGAGQDLKLASSTFPVELFPPAELLEAAGSECFVCVFPVKSMSTDWGFLAIADPISSSFVGQDFVFMWSAMFSEALDHRALMWSLSQRSDDLARSYEREKEMARAVRESEERYALAAQAANDGLWDWDLARGTVYFSSRWKEMLGYEAAEIGDRPEEWLERVHPDDCAALSSALSALKRGEQPSLLNEHRVRAGDGHYKWALCRGLAVPGAGVPAARIVGSLTDITERRLLEERLRHQALFDNLTGLPNRALFMDRLSQAVATAKRRPGYTYTVLWLDLDNFKNLNDSLGHQFGDKLLVHVAERIRAQLREPDTAARFGGDEFAFLVLDVQDFSVVQRIVRRLLDSLGAPYHIDGHDVAVTGSLGVATSTTGYECPEDVLRDADIAMYMAKSTARGSYATFDSSMHALALARHETETELRQAIESSVHRLEAPGASFPPYAAALFASGRDGTDAGGHGFGSHLELHYQPVVDLTSGAVEALEALVRWRHPVRGLVHPVQFLPVAEDSGLIVPMGKWVVAEACHQMAAWHFASVVAPGTRVSINLSNREFWDPRFFDQFDRTLHETGVRPDLIALEITEGVIMDDIDRAVQMLNKLHARQVQIHVDDFGTGYSSLQSLHRLPIDFLKIDTSFVAGLGEDERTAELVRTIIQLGRSIGVGVIAEGVATPEQHHILLDLGCRLGQGYLFSPPLPPDELEEPLARGRMSFAAAAGRLVGLY